MPRVFKSGPYDVRFYSNENAEPPHVHVFRGEAQAKVWLTQPVELASSKGFSAVEQRAILKLVAERRLECLNSWRAYFEGDA